MSITDELREWMGVVLTDDDPAHAIADRIDASVASEYVELPKDADGETIHVGDVMDGYGKIVEVVEMRYGRSGWALISRDGNGYADTFAFAHHHEPTAEDVLRECIANVCRSNAQLYEQGCSPLTMDDIDEELDEYINEYAVRLRLAEGEEQ